jgi:hypothetical protein
MTYVTALTGWDRYQWHDMIPVRYELDLYKCNLGDTLSLNSQSRTGMDSQM